MEGGKRSLKFVFFNVKWYLECGNKYNDHGDVHDESEKNYKMMYE